MAIRRVRALARSASTRTPALHPSAPARGLEISAHRQPGQSHHARARGLALPRPSRQRSARSGAVASALGRRSQAVFRGNRQLRARPRRPVAGSDRSFFPGNHRWHRLPVRIRLRRPMDALLANPSRAQAVILGLLLGGLLLAKFNSPPLFALVLGLVLLLAPGEIKFNPRGFQWRRAAAVCLIACLVVWSRILFPRLQGDLRQSDGHHLFRRLHQTSAVRHADPQNSGHHLPARLRVDDRTRHGRLPQHGRPPQFPSGSLFGPWIQALLPGGDAPEMAAARAPAGRCRRLRRVMAQGSRLARLFC